MTLISQRDQLDERLRNVANVLLILIGDDDTTRAVHTHVRDLARDGKLRADFVPLRLADLSLLTNAEQSQWSATPGGFVSLGVDASSNRVARASGPVTDLLRVNGRPSTLRIKRAFRDGSGA